MPWEKSFNEDDAVRNAMLLFWEKGFASTSISELLAKTGVNRGSLYNAFGGKQPLFVKALNMYNKEVRRGALSELEALDNPRLAIEKLFDGAVEEVVADEQKKGCFLVNTASEIAVHDEEVVEITNRGIREFEAFFRRCIEVGQSRGEIRSDLKPEPTAKKLLALVSAIRVLGRGLFNESDLKMIANEAKQTIM